MPPDTYVLTVRVRQSARERLLEEATMNGMTLSEWVRHKLGVVPGEVVQDDRYDDHERRISRLEEIAHISTF